MPLDDQTRLKHIRDSAIEAMGYAKGKDKDEFLSTRIVLQAPIRCLEVVDEAASGVSESLKSEFPQIPWRQIVGMRNRLIDAYFDVDGEQVWETVQRDLPKLLAQVQSLIEER